jgi:hypothetical protein
VTTGYTAYLTIRSSERLDSWCAKCLFPTMEQYVVTVLTPTGVGDRTVTRCRDCGCREIMEGT